MADADDKVDFGLADVGPDAPSPLDWRSVPPEDEPDPEWWVNYWAGRPVDLGWLIAQAGHLKVR